MKLLCLIFCASVVLAQRTFETPEAAAQALIDAAASDNTPTLNAIFGPQGKTILTSGSAEQDKAQRDEFASIAKNKHRLQRDSTNPDRMILCIGSEDWPFAVPIVGQNGQWHFDASASEDVVKARRIGADELDAIEICAGYVGAQRQFAEQHGMQQYARTLEELGTLVPPELIQAGASNPQPYHGYFFRVLSAQGKNALAGEHDYVVQGTMLAGFGLVGWPAEYGITGVHTFMVSQDGMVYQKDLGASAPPVAKYDPDPSWKPVY